MSESDINRLQVISDMIGDELQCSNLLADDGVAGLLQAARDRIDEAVRIVTGRKA